MCLGSSASERAAKASELIRELGSFAAVFCCAELTVVAYRSAEGEHCRCNCVQVRDEVRSTVHVLSQVNTAGFLWH